MTAGGPTGLLSAVLARQQGLSVSVIGMVEFHPTMKAHLILSR